MAKVDFKELSDRLKDNLSLIVAGLRQGQEQISGGLEAMGEFIHRLNTDIAILSSKKESLFLNVAALEVKVKEADEKLNELKKQGDEEIVKQKENLDRIVKEESARLRVKNDESGKKEKEAEAILNNSRQSQAEAQSLLLNIEKQQTSVKNELERLSNINAEINSSKESLDLLKMNLGSERREIDKKAQTAIKDSAYAIEKEKSALAIQEDNLNIKKVNEDTLAKIEREKERLGQIKRKLDEREKEILKKEGELYDKQTDIGRQYKNLKDKEFNLASINKETKKKK